MDWAAQSLEQALQIWPDEPAWQARAASLAEEANNFSKAALHWKSAAHLVPGNSEYALAFGRCLAHMERYQEAVEAFDRATRLNPSDYEGWFDLAAAAKMAGNLPEAMESAQRASHLRPEDVRGLLLVSGIAIDMGDVDTAAPRAPESYGCFSTEQCFRSGRQRRRGFEYYRRKTGRNVAITANFIRAGSVGL